jgi:hypothetical protein
MDYVYSVASDIASAKIFPDRLKDEIDTSSISQSLDRIQVDGDVLQLGFSAALTAGEITTLDAILLAHSGEPYSEAQEAPVLVSFQTEDSSGTPKVVTTKPTGNFDTIITANFCDNTTWVNGPTDSSWEMVPDAGKVINVDRAEAQFEHDIQISPNEIYLDYHAWVAPATTMMVQRITFTRVQDLFALGNSHYHAPALPECPNGLSTILFNYANKLRFYGSESLGQLYKLVISTSNNNEITGSYATIGFVTEVVDQ